MIAKKGSLGITPKLPVNDSLVREFNEVIIELVVTFDFIDS